MNVRRGFLLLALSLSFIFAFPWQTYSRPQSLAELAEIMRHVVAVPMPGAIAPLFRPRYDTIREADLKMTANEPVFVVLLPGGARIYPQQYMVWHQIVNESIDDKAYAITYCPITGTLMAYDAYMEEMNLVFNVEGHDSDDGFSGYLYDGNSVMIDRNTGSLWLQETGMAFDGPLLGRGMPTIPVFWTTWEAAKRVYPDAPVLSRPRGRRPYGRDPYGSYARTDSYYHNDTLAYAVRRLDRRFPRKTSMLCLEYDKLLVAIDIEYVKQKGVVNFFLGPNPLLAVYDRRLEVVRIFNRQVWADPFLFIMNNGKLMDLTTKSYWSPETGAALEGNMAGATMKQSFGVYSMWFAWYSINPETLVIPGPGEVPANLLSPDAPGVGQFAQPPQKPESPDGLPGSSHW